MSSVLSQELLDIIVDNVRSILGWPAAEAPLRSLLKAARCFGPRCRRYIYKSIKLSVKVDSGILDEPRKKRNLRILDIIQDPLNGIGWFVKRVTYDLCFDSDEVVCILETSAWDTLTRLKHLLVNIEDVRVDFTQYYLHSLYSYRDIHFDAPLAHAITKVLPMSAFTKLEINGVKLHPAALVEMLYKHPHITALDLSNITYDHGKTPDPRLAGPSNITELGIFDTELLEAEIAGLQHFFSGVRRLILLSVALNDDAIGGIWVFLAEFLTTIKQLDELYLDLSYRAAGPELPEMLLASSLWLELGKPAHLARLADSLVAEVDFPINLQRMTVIWHYNWDPTEWRVLAHALYNPRLSMVTVTIVINCASRTVDERRIEETRKYFDECPVKVTVKCLTGRKEWHLCRHALY